MSMNCSECGGQTRVIRGEAPNDGVYRRRRECLTCNRRFNTREEEAKTGKDWGDKKAALVLSDRTEDTVCDAFCPEGCEAKDTKDCREIILKKLRTGIPAKTQRKRRE